MARAEPGADEAEIRAALARALASDELRKSPRLAAFLAFVVEEELAGRGGALKAYTIATGALGRPTSFDAATDPAVRVEANRLRRALAAWYDGESGRREPLRIVLTPGGYRPTFESAVVPPEAAELASGQAPRTARPRWWPWAAAVATLALVAVGWFAWTNRAGQPAVEAAAPTAIARPTVAVRPLAARGAAATLSGEAFAERLTDALARFDTIRVVAATDGRPAVSDYRIEVEVEAVAEGRVTIAARVTRTRTGEIALARRFEGLDPRAVDLVVIRALSHAVASPDGLVMADARAGVLAVDAGYRCAAVASTLFRVYDPALRDQSLACAASATRADPTNPLAFIVLSYVEIVAFRDGFAGSLERAVAAANRALELAPERGRAHHAMMQALFSRGVAEEWRRHGERALALNPFDADVIGDFGARLVATGLVPQGRARIDEAIAVMSSPPVWLLFYAYLGAYLDGDGTARARWAGRIDGDGYAMGLAARLVEAAETGDIERARAAAARLRARHPEIAANIPAAVGRVLSIGPAGERWTRAIEDALRRAEP